MTYDDEFNFLDDFDNYNYDTFYDPAPAADFFAAGDALDIPTSDIPVAQMTYEDSPLYYATLADSLPKPPAIDELFEQIMKDLYSESITLQLESTDVFVKSIMDAQEAWARPRPPWYRRLWAWLTYTNPA